ncbi:MAG: hypothetical protein RIT81_33775 [Deltaproteobacteria bacterium]
MNFTALSIAAWGVALGLHPPEAKRIGFDPIEALSEIRSLRADAVLLPVPWTTSTVEAGDLFRTEETIADDALVATIRTARSEGLKVALHPFVVVKHGADDAWRGVLRPRAPDRWWSQYRAMILHYAAIAEREHVALFAIGSELTSLQDDERWASLARDVRRSYRGRIAYVANHDALDRTAVFEHVDVAGVSAYFPLTTDLDADLESLRAGWRDATRRIEKLRREVERPVIVFEVGYPSIDGAATRPWDDTLGAPIDLEEQRRAYVAACEALLSAPIEGAFFWNWFGPGGRHDRTFTPRHKPAEAVLRRFFTAATESRRPRPRPPRRRPRAATRAPR